jgi:hypothetical protein
MTFNIPRLTKQNSNYVKAQKTTIKIPDNWLDFARMLKIRSGGVIVNFEPFDYQIKLVDMMLARSVCVAKSRQLGVSETVSSLMLWRAAKEEGYLGLVFSKTQGDTGLIARRMRRMINSIGLTTVTDNLQDIELSTGGRILFRNSKPDAARSIESVVDVFWDESGFVDELAEIRAAVAPTQQMVGDKAREFMVSTPNGKQGVYWDTLNESNGFVDIEEEIRTAADEPYKEWVDSGGWGKVLIHWKAHPIYGGNPNFLQEIHERKKLSWDTIEREYNLSFDSTSEGLIIRQFKPEVHLKEFEFIPDYPLCISFDFNRSPATALIGQRQEDIIVIFEEIYLLNSDTFESAALARTIAEKYQPYIVNLYGDASGKMFTANSQYSNWQIVNNAFADIPWARCYGVSNPPVINTINAVNSMFQDNRIFVNPRCKELIKDFLQCTSTKNGDIDKKDIARTHLLDCFRYFVERESPYR